MQEACIAVNNLDCGKGSVPWAQSVPGVSRTGFKFGSAANRCQPQTELIGTNVLLMFLAVGASRHHQDIDGNVGSANEELPDSPASIGALSQAFAKWMVRYTN